ncbi:PIN2/TERF1-interacting telomerase inhibitor 1-like [Amyelois transitella]|uniref:PIN2/TERF1-interacting telomerase inhibitor 1-like n=1 Tax=Amyelois transitella TaxID=680683 RepID=UPI0029902B8F|nr:PIN2/TERF1-interacting telomerase inhibitor 1-like [Amyelois transitella]
MSMLAGPRRKQKVINLRAKNNDWSNDNNKFGQRMLEKMGWSSGKGLGANENGIVEHVVARYKNDEKGLGFEDKNDQWTKHEDDFNALLANLSNDDTNVEKLHSGISLEVKSKTSKARVHYHKFTRGKDLTRYSEKDLANIFGKKSLKVKEETEILITKDIKAEKESDKIFTEKGSMEDYFKSKLAAFKSKSILLFNKNTDIGNTDEDENAEYVFQGFSSNCNEEKQELNNSCGFKPFSFYSSNHQTEDNSQLNFLDKEQLSGSGLSKKKKKKKSKEQDTTPCVSEVDTNSQVQDQVEENCDALVSKKKKKKKSKHLNVELEDMALVPAEKNINIVDSPDVYVENVPKKKKKNKRRKSLSPELENKQVETDICSLIPKKKKKKKNTFEG